MTNNNNNKMISLLLLQSTSANMLPNKTLKMEKSTDKVHALFIKRWK